MTPIESRDGSQGVVQVFYNYSTLISSIASAGSGLFILATTHWTAEVGFLGFVLVIYIPTVLAAVFYSRRYRALAKSLEVIKEVDLPLRPGADRTETITCQLGQMFFIQAASARHFAIIANLTSGTSSQTFFDHRRVLGASERIVTTANGMLVIGVKNISDRRNIIVHYVVEATRGR